MCVPLNNEAVALACHGQILGRREIPENMSAFFSARVYADLEGLECSERAGNIINRKIRLFYIEAVSKFFSQLRKKIFFFALQKIFFRVENVGF